jgi:hypothetical protein
LLGFIAARAAFRYQEAINELQSITGSARNNEMGETHLHLSRSDREVKRTPFCNPAMGAIRTIGVLVLRSHLQPEADVAGALALSPIGPFLRVCPVVGGQRSVFHSIKELTGSVSSRPESDLPFLPEWR